MQLRSSLGVFRLSVLLALGLPASACSGDSTEDGKVTPCSNSKPMSGQPELEQCSEGFVHRPRTAQCQSQLPRPDKCDPTLGGGPAACSTDADCTDKPHGQCGIVGQIVECSCQYGCVTDADCDSGEVCSCGNPVGRCTKATCKTDADCSGGALCVQTRMTKCSWSSGFACQRPNDACLTDQDCAPGEQCALTDAGRKCLQNDCPVPGRPFLVDEQPRVAAAARRRDWSEDLAPRWIDVPEAKRADLAEHWTKVGQMEHASVAAFARFALQLLGLGAPAYLVEEVQQAMVDETRHAKVCFGLASAYLRRPVGPGSLQVDDALGDQDVAEVVRMTFREGCVGETSAAHEARQSGLAAMDPVVKDLLAGIAADEERHALTAWKFVKWALGAFGAPVRNVLRQEIARLEAQPAAVSQAKDDLAPHGVLAESTRLSLHAEAIRTVVLPCARALLEAPRQSVPVAAA